MKRFGIAMLLALLAGAAPAVAHDHWIAAADYFPAVGGSLAVSICSGHAYPESGFALSRKLIGGTIAVAPGGSKMPFDVEEREKRWSGSFECHAPGVILASFTLEKKQVKKPLFQGKAIFVAGCDIDDPASYLLGEGLEIVPLEALTRLEPGTTLPLSVVDNGAAVNAVITITPEEGRTVRLSTTPRRAAEFEIPGAGRYLLTASADGTACSLTLAIPGNRAPERGNE